MVSSYMIEIITSEFFDNIISNNFDGIICDGFNIKIHNNIIRDNSGVGVRLLNGNNIKVYRNYIENNKWGITLKIERYSVYIHHNQIKDNELGIYVDTSVIGGVYDPEFKEWSKKLIQEFKKGSKIIVLSDLTLRELEESPEQVKKVINTIPDRNKEFVELNDEAKNLAKNYISEICILH